MPQIPAGRARVLGRPTSRRRTRVVVLGDLMLDVVIRPRRPPAAATDVPGSVVLRQGGSAATTALWLAKLGADATLVTAVGRDAPGRALIALLTSAGVRVRAVRATGERTGRIAVLVDPAGERSFVTDRGAADRLGPADLRAGWFERAALLHLPAYSILAGSLGRAGLAAVGLARGGGALVSLDLASTGPLLEAGRASVLERIRGIRPEVLLATRAEAEALLGGVPVDELLALAPTAVVKRGQKGATVLAREGRSRLRFEVATRSLAAPDTTGAGDAFDAGFLLAWLADRAAGRSITASLQRAALAGHRAAARHVSATRPELSFG